MRRNIAAGAMAGPIGAVDPGLLLQLVTISASDGARMSLIVMAARVVRSTHAPIGWLVILGYGVVAGALFGRLVRDRSLPLGIAVVEGAFYGVGWWIVSGLVLVPTVLGLVPLSPITVDLMRPVALPTMIASGLYGAVLGAAFTIVAKRLHRSQRRHPVTQTTARAA